MAAKSGVLSYVVGNIVVRTSVYYVVLFGLAMVLSRLPVAQDVMHGAMESLIAGGGPVGLSKSQAIREASTISITATTLALTVAVAMLASVLLALPVAWIYTLTRHQQGFQQSVVQTLMILPPLVAGVVVLVKYSVALAFSLAGIVAAVKFRNTLDDSKDAVYVFLATAIGLAAAVQLPVAAVISVAFNILVLGLWLTDFGKPAAFDGMMAKRKMEETVNEMRQTGSFVATLDREIFDKMTPEQLDAAVDRAWKRRRKLDADRPSDEEMQKRDVLLRIKVNDPNAARSALEEVFVEFLKKWRFVGNSKDADGSQHVEYAVQLKKGNRADDLEIALSQKPEVLFTEFK